MQNILEREKLSRALESIVGQPCRSGKLLSQWETAKQKLFALLGDKLTHEVKIEEPLTNEEIFRLWQRFIKDQYCGDLPSYTLIYAFTTDEIRQNKILYGFSDALKNPADDDQREALLELQRQGKTWQKGQKISKFLLSTITDEPNYKHINGKPMSKHDFTADQFSQMQQKFLTRGNLILSIDPIDYLTMSISSSGWSSCHDARKEDGERGAYAGGTLSYMADETTIIAYVTTGKIRELHGSDGCGTFSHTSKLWRMCVYVDTENRSAVFSRQYPSSNDAYTKSARKAIAELLGKYHQTAADYKVNFKAYKETETFSRNIQSGHGSLIFNDLGGEHEKSCIKLKDSGEYPSITIGAAPYCPICGGRKVTDAVLMGCDSCDDNEKYSCYHCGDYMRENAVFEGADGNDYCESCFNDIFSTCEYCDRLENNDDLHYIEGHGSVCERCLDRHFTSCDSCGDYFDEDLTGVEGDWLCRSCLENEATYCENCADWFYSQNTQYDDEGSCHYCNDCMDEINETRSANSDYDSDDEESEVA